MPLLAPVPEFPFFGGPGAAPGHSGSPSRQATRLRLQVAVDDLSSVRALDACGGLSDVAGMSPPEEHVALLHRHQALAGLAAVAPAHPRPEVHMPDDYFSRLSSRLRTDAARDIVKVTEIAQLDVGKRRQVVVQLSESSLNGPAARVVLREPPPADPAAWRRETFVFLRAPELDAFIEALQAARAKLPTEGA